MKQFKSGDAVKVVMRKDNVLHGRVNGLSATYGYRLLLAGHAVFVPEFGCVIIADDVETIGKTLLEILVDELPKRGGWRGRANACVQDSDKSVKFNVLTGALTMNSAGDWSSKPDEFDDYGWVGANLLGVSDLATDHATKIVTREEYDRAVAIKASGDNNAATKKTFHANNWMITIAGENYTLAQKQLEDSIMKGRFTVEVDCTLGALPVPEIKKPEESKLQHIEQIRKARDEAMRDYNGVFVSGDSELRKLKLGDEVVFEDGKSTWLLIEIQERGSMERNVRVCTFSSNRNRREFKVSSNTPYIRFAKVS